VNAILLAEANIDLEAIRQKLTPKTEVIYPGHYAVVSCDIEQIVEIAEEHDLKLVEDAAQGVNAKYNNKYLGTIVLT
jgi:dTDP-4-amino-4,6-dideoxygalactose transaminase